MPIEIINQDELAAIAAAARYVPDHAELLAALAARYPSWELNVVAVRGPGTIDGTAVVDGSGNQVADDYRVWLEKACREEGDARALWERYKEAGLRRTETAVHTLVIAAPYDDREPDGFLQIETDPILLLKV